MHPVLPITLETPDEILVGEPVTVRVRDHWKRPVEGVTIRTSRRILGRTDDTGRCRIELAAPGFWKLLVVKSPDERFAYEPLTALVRVLPGASPLTDRVAAPAT
ncbi:carboxypeptidase regulatory-like domain-containing protein [Saliphagus sp. GCM10025308]